MRSLRKGLLWHMLAVVLVALMLPLASPYVRAATNDSTVPGVHLASPAVVRIIMSVSGEVICQNCAIGGRTMTFPLNGGSYLEDFSGSGTIISPDGDVLTADHVVDWQGPAVQSVFYDRAVDEYARTANISVEEANSLFTEFLKQNRLSIPTTLINQRVFLATTYTGSLQKVSQVMSFGVERFVISSPHEKFEHAPVPAMLRDDVAIIKIGAHDLPYLTLTSASTIQVQDSVTALAFPGDADLSDFTELLNTTRSDVNTLTSLLTPTVETGQITAEKTFQSGTLYYEVSDIGAPGSSGGPVINSLGQMIGFIDLGSSTGRVLYLMPSSIIASYTKRAGITNQQQGAFMSLWTKAINEYDATGPCHWTRAYQELKELHDKYSQFGGIQPFLQESRSKATPSECPAPAPPPSTPGWLIPAVVGGGIILLGVAGAFLVVYVFLRNKKAKSLPAGMPIQSNFPDPSKRIGGMTASLSTGNAPTYMQGQGSAFDQDPWQLPKVPIKIGTTDVTNAHEGVQPSQSTWATETLLNTLSDHSTQPAIPVPAGTSNVSQSVPATDADQTPRGASGEAK